MERYYSDTLCKGLRLLYFQADSAKFPEGIRFLKQAVENEEPHAFYFLTRCYGWGDGNVKEDDGEPMAQYAIGLFYFWGDMFLNFQKPSNENFAKCEKEKTQRLNMINRVHAPLRKAE